MSIRDRLATKKPARVVVPVVVDELSPERAAQLAELQMRAVQCASAGDRDGANAAVEAARDLTATVQVDVEFVALPAVDFEAVVASHPSPDGDDSGLDWRSALPVLAALCATDPDLADDGWWRNHLSAWSSGELLTLWGALLRLNTAAPAAHLPKG